MNIRPIAASLMIAAALPCAAPARAAPDSTSEAASKEAVKYYKEGHRLVSQRKYGQALEALDKSLELLPSPNTELLKAQALRELGRLGLERLPGRAVPGQAVHLSYLRRPAWCSSHCRSARAPQRGAPESRRWLGPCA